MALRNLLFEILCIALVDSYILSDFSSDKIRIGDFNKTSDDLGVNNSIVFEADENNASEAFNGVYTECFLYLSYSCIQKKTLLYLQKLNELREISVLGEYLKFVKMNSTYNSARDQEIMPVDATEGTGELSSRIDQLVDKFFENHVLRIKALGKDIAVPRTVEDFVGRKKRKGGGGGGGGGGHHGDGDGGKKKMMMMAMMCMKMKLMMMVPAMMGMMGMMSFKGMMFSMMSFMISKMMLLMKILEKKGGMGGGGGGSDPGWAAGGGGGAWMPAGGSPDYGGGGGGGGGGYDANGQWQSRSIPQTIPEDITYTIQNAPEITYVKPTIRYSYERNPAKELQDEVIKIENGPAKSRKKRGLFDVIQNAYLYWINRMLGVRRYNNLKQQKYRIVNGVKYVYYPLRYVKAKPHKPVSDTTNEVKIEDYKPIITVQDFNKGEIVDSPEESRMNKKKFQKIKDTVDAAVDDNPWE